MSINDAALLVALAVVIAAASPFISVVVLVGIALGVWAAAAVSAVVWVLWRWVASLLR